MTTLLSILFGHRPQRDLVAEAVQNAVRRNREAANNLEATIRDLLDENQRLRIGRFDAPPN